MNDGRARQRCSRGAAAAFAIMPAAPDVPPCCNCTTASHPPLPCSVTAYSKLGSDFDTSKPVTSVLPPGAWSRAINALLLARCLVACECGRQPGEGIPEGIPPKGKKAGTRQRAQRRASRAAAPPRPPCTLLLLHPALASVLQPSTHPPTPLLTHATGAQMP